MFRYKSQTRFAFDCKFGSVFNQNAYMRISMCKYTFTIFAFVIKCRDLVATFRKKAHNIFHFKCMTFMGAHNTN